MKKSLYILCASLTMLVSCESDRFGDEIATAADGSITFLISSPVDEAEWQTRSDDGEKIKEQIESMIYLIADGKGRVLNHYYSRLSPSFDRLNVDGLAAGDYSIVLLAASEQSAFAEIATPSRLDEEWLSNTLSTLPIGGSYFYKKTDFSVGLTPSSMTREIELGRALAQVKVEIPGLQAAVENMISSVKVSLDDGSCLYSSLSADGTYTGEATVTGHELRDAGFNLSMSTMPSAGAVSGTVKIISATLSGDTISSSYRFSDIKLEAGKTATITVRMQHPDFETGFILVRPKDYYDYDADLMMMEDEPMAVLHDANHRNYPVCRPLMVTTWEDNMRVRLFAGGAAEDVDIYADFPSLGLDSVRVAHFDRVEPMLDMLVPMPFLNRACNYYDIHGKRVSLPRMDRIPTDISWYIKTSDPYLNQLAAVQFQHWRAWCPSYETYWARYAIQPTCDIIRHAFVINQNIAIMLESEEFLDLIEANTGTYINNGEYLTNEDIINRVYNNSGYGWGSCNPASGAEGWGGGSTMIFMAGYLRAAMYPGVNTAKPWSWPREVLFHELGHCLGFSHSGNMTYGGKWVSITSNAYVECFLHGKMPFGVPDFIDSIPYKREDAPKWARPRFVIPEQTEAASKPAKAPGYEPVS